MTAAASKAMALILEARGSAPQVPGATAHFTRRGLDSGTVGGGVLEATAERKAKRALKSGRAEVFDISLDKSGVDEEGALCGGEAKVLIDPRPDRPAAVYKKMEKARRARRPGLLLTYMRGSPFPSVTRCWLEKGGRLAGASRPLLSEFRKDIRAAALDGRVRFVPGAKSGLFIQPWCPPPRLIVAGAGHIGRAVCRLGEMLDFEVTVIDDRAEFADPKKLPGAAHVIQGDIGRTVGELSLGKDTYLVIVTRGHAHDAEALRQAIARPAAYIGMIGSRRKVRILRRDFLARGWATAGEWARVRTPIGLPIGSRSVAEIAVSIAAELVKVRRDLEGGSSGATTSRRL